MSTLTRTLPRATSGGVPAPARRRRRSGVGALFVTPYLLYTLVVFAYPARLAVWISFHGYFFTAPGTHVARPFVGFDNYQDVLTDPAVRSRSCNIAIFLVINVPLTVVLVAACWPPR